MYNRQERYTRYLKKIFMKKVFAAGDGQGLSATEVLSLNTKHAITNLCDYCETLLADVYRGALITVLKIDINNERRQVVITFKYNDVVTDREEICKHSLEY